MAKPSAKRIKGQVHVEPLPPPEEPKTIPEGLSRAEITHVQRRAAEHKPPSPDDRFVRSRCVNCNGPMWTRDPQKEDTCDDCYYEIITEQGELTKQALNSAEVRGYNPFL